MNLDFQQIKELLGIINNNQLIVGSEYAEDFVTEEDRITLMKFEIDFKKPLPSPRLQRGLIRKSTRTINQ